MPMRRGFLVRVAILDWYSRSGLAGMVAHTQDTAFCLQALEPAFHHDALRSSIAIRAARS